VRQKLKFMRHSRLLSTLLRSTAVASLLRSTAVASLLRSTAVASLLMSNAVASLLRSTAVASLLRSTAVASLLMSNAVAPLLMSNAVAQTVIDNDDINRVQYQHERSPGYVKSARATRLPAQFASMTYRPPVIKDWLLPYLSWEQKDRTYFQRNYGENKLTLSPSMIVMHYTVIPTAEDTYQALTRKKVSVHFMIAPDGTVYRLLPENRRCSGAYGVDHVALSIEMVARTEADLLSRAQQVFSSFCLVRHLMEQYGIPLSQVVAHYEVGEGKRKVPQYTDLYDTVFPDRYPPSEARLDPGPTYMSWLRTYLKENPASPR
jgi:hypothetical protein